MPRSFFKPTDLIEQAMEISQTTETKINVVIQGENNSYNFYIKPVDQPQRLLSLYMDHEFSGVGYTADQIMTTLLEYVELEVDDEV